MTVRHVARCWFVALATAIALSSITPAAAGGPVITDEVEQDSFSITECGFDIIQTYALQRRVFRWYDEAGNLLREKRILNITGTFTNIATGKTLPFESHNARVRDFRANTNTLTGARLLIRVPGQGVLAMEAGRRVDDFDLGPATVFDAGRINFDLCTLLA